MKYYFAPVISDENCFTKKDLLEDMKEQGLNEIEIFPAKMTTGESYSYCSEWREPIDKDDNTCGKGCEEYSPRNGKNGRCRHSKNCYEPADESITLKRKE